MLIEIGQTCSYQMTYKFETRTCISFIRVKTKTFQVQKQNPQINAATVEVFIAQNEFKFYSNAPKQKCDLLLQQQ